MYIYILYIISTIIVCILFFFAYIKIKFKFWALQPVFHIYNYNYYLFPPGIIEHELPIPNKYTNFKNIETIVFSKLSEFKRNEFTNFIRLHYFREKNNYFSPDNKNILPYLTNHFTLSFISFYNESEILLNAKDNTTIDRKRIVGIITSRPLHICIRPKNENKPKYLNAYYVDYLCINKLWRKKGIAPQMIQTHQYNQSHLNKSIAVSLFKREEDLTGIVPLCFYYTYGFSIIGWKNPKDINKMYNLIEITPSNYYFLYNFIKTESKQFDIIINTESANIIELIKTKNIFIYAILLQNKIICAYFFRKTCIYINNNLEVLSCFASISSCNLFDSIFIDGFKISFWKIAKKNNFGFCSIENISHNYKIIHNISLKTQPIIKSPTAYFFYNFAYPSFHPEKTLIII
jgi:hypothetical protein